MSSQANSCLEVLVAVLTLIRRRDECGSRGAGSDLSLCTLLGGLFDTTALKYHCTSMDADAPRGAGGCEALLVCRMNG